MADDLLTYTTSQKLDADPSKTVTGTDYAGNKRALDTNVLGGTITGTFTPSGLTTAGRTTTMDVNGTAQAVPAVPLANRNAISIHNLDPLVTIYVGFVNTVTADRVLGTTSGWEIDPNGNMQFDITDDIILWVITSGATVRIKVLEVA